MSRQEFTINELKWIKIQNPTEDDFDYIQRSFKFHQLVLETIRIPTLHPLLQDYGDHIYLILHFPIIYKTAQPNEIVEVDFLITKNALITITDKEYAALDQLSSEIDKNQEIKENIAKNGLGFLLYFIIDRLFERLLIDFDWVEEAINKLENRLFSHDEKPLAIIEDLSHAERDILDFKHVLTTQQTIIKYLPEKLGNFFNRNMVPYFNDLLTAADRIKSFVEDHKDILSSLRLTYESLVSSRTSHIIKVLTLFSAVILPLSFIAAIWGMNHKYMPLRDGPYDFWIFIGIVLAVVGIITAIFKKKKWL